MTKIDEVLDKHWQDLRGLKNVLNVAISEELANGQKTGKQSITLFVVKKEPKFALSKESTAPDEIDGIPIDVIEIKADGWEPGETSISKLHPSVQKKLVAGVKPKDKSPKVMTPKKRVTITDLDIDWASLAQAIVDQMSCGSCTAFGITGVIEALFKLIFGIDIKLSEQHLFTCSGGTCDGGNSMSPVLNQAMKGICLESCLPYSQGGGKDFACKEGICANWWETAKKISAWSGVTDKDQMRLLIATKPLVTTMAVPYSFMNYKKGIYKRGGLNDLIAGYHCIGCFGAKDVDQAWKGRNSWNAGWGEDGYFRIAYGECDFDDEMYDLTPTNDPVPPDPGPNPDPTPNPCKLAKIGLAIWPNSVLALIGKDSHAIYVKKG